MSQENVELVREMQQGWNRGETAVSEAAWHPDGVSKPAPRDGERYPYEAHCRRSSV